MNELTEGLSVVLVAAGLMSFVLALMMSRRVGGSVLMMLDLWTAAGLLRLSGLVTWNSILVVAVIIIVRKLVAGALKRGHRFA